MNLSRYYLFLTLILVTILTSCRYNQSIMLRTPKNYNYAKFSTIDSSQQYKIAINDEITFQVFANDGSAMVDVTNNLNNEHASKKNTFLVEFDGMVNIPVIGRTSIVGLSIREAELKLENAFSKFYNNPFVVIKVTNKRVIVFPGDGNNAKIIPLTNENMTLIEAIAATGGISSSGKAHKIKLIRGNLKNPEVYLIDLSTIDGLKQADLVLQANDIVYVEPRENFAKFLMNEYYPYLSILTTVVLMLTIIQRL